MDYIVTDSSPTLFTGGRSQCKAVGAEPPMRGISGPFCGNRWKIFVISWQVIDGIKAFFYFGLLHCRSWAALTATPHVSALTMGLHPGKVTLQSPQDLRKTELVMVVTPLTRHLWPPVPLHDRPRCKKKRRKKNNLLIYLHRIKNQ